MLKENLTMLKSVIKFLTQREKDGQRQFMNRTKTETVELEMQLHRGALMGCKNLTRENVNKKRPLAPKCFTEEHLRDYIDREIWFRQNTIPIFEEHNGKIYKIGVYANGQEILY